MKTGPVKSTNFYHLLEIDRDAEKKDIKKAYKRLVARYHPDICKDQDNEINYKEIVRAYTVLKDAELRKEYDKELNENIKLFSQFHFDFDYKGLLKHGDKLLNRIKIFFKNMTGISQARYDKDSEVYPILKCPINVPAELVDMSTDDLEQRLLHSQNKYVCIHAAYAIGLKKEKQGFSILKELLYHPEPEVRKAVIWSIGNLGMKKSIALLKAFYESTDDVYKSGLLKSIFNLAKGKGNLLFNLLIQALDNDNNDVRETGLELLYLTKKNIPCDCLKKIQAGQGDRTGEILNKLNAEKRIIG